MRGCYKREEVRKTFWGITHGLEKVFVDSSNVPMVNGEVVMLENDRVSFQFVVIPGDEIDAPVKYRLAVVSSLGLDVQEVRNVVVTLPAKGNADDFYLTKTPGIFPDVLSPFDGTLTLAPRLSQSFWINLSTKRGDSGLHTVRFIVVDLEGDTVFEKELSVQVRDVALGALDLKHTEWFHQDSLLSYYNVDCWSDRHWELIGNYLTFAHARAGVDTVLTPIFTPPLDTAVGHERATVQLVGISLRDGKYSFNFERLKRWCRLCGQIGIKNIELAHFFTQWGAKYTPKIIVEEQGREIQKFGWHVQSSSDEYSRFLHQFVPALIDELNECGFENTHIFFHVSDEPRGTHVDDYIRCRNLLKPLVRDCRIIDAVSDVEFYTRGLIDQPVVANNHVKDFKQFKPREMWTYYCVSQGNLVPNRFIAMPSLRNRIMGVLLYYHAISGFLHWGYNFYFSQYALKAVNPYLVTDAGLAFTAGDPYLVYPGEDGHPLSSIRNEVQMEGFNDYKILKLLEKRTSRAQVLDMIDGIAGYSISFEEYPHENDFIFRIRRKAIELLTS